MKALKTLALAILAAVTATATEVIIKEVVKRRGDDSSHPHAHE